MTILEAYNIRESIKSVKIYGQDSASRFTGKTKHHKIFGRLIELKHKNGKTSFEQSNATCDAKLKYKGTSPVPFIVSQAMKYTR